MALGDAYPDSPIKVICTCARGTERALKFELKDLGYPRSQILRGAVQVEAPRAVVADANVFLRVASRVLWQMTSFEAKTEQALVEQLGEFPFEDLVDARRSIMIEAHLGRGAPWNNTKYAAQKVKDVIVDRLRGLGHGRPDVDLDAPYMKLVLHWDEGVATLSVDTTGRPLGQRGYRRGGGPAPMRENLAAAILAIGHADVRRPFLDPVCGTGTLGIEQALRALNRFPGAKRTFHFERWAPEDVLQALARAKEKAADGVLQKTEAPIRISDHDADQITRAGRAVERLGIGDFVDLRLAEVTEVQADEGGVIVANPPFGERMGRDDEQGLRKLYGELGELASSKPGNRLLVFSSWDETERAIGLGKSKNWALYSGPLKTTLHRWDLDRSR
jgi:putative N6-adenine-specific DNA methylase